jgi:uncharacterized membrane protein (DUF485 family)
VRKKKGEIGESPGAYSAPSWRGTLLMLLVIVVFLALVAYAFVWIGQPLTPQIRIPPAALRL